MVVLKESRNNVSECLLCLMLGMRAREKAY